MGVERGSVSARSKAMELIAVPDAARRTGLSPEFIRQLARQAR